MQEMSLLGSYIELLELTENVRNFLTQVHQITIRIQ